MKQTHSMRSFHWLQHSVDPRRSAGLALSLALALGCAVDAEPERLGFTDEPLTATEPAEPALRPADFVGRWRGQAPDLLELTSGTGGVAPAYQFPSGSSDITIEIGADALGSLEGSLVFGGAPLPAATDPLASFPPGTSYAEDYDENAPAFEGARYDLSFVPLNSELAPENRAGLDPSVVFDGLEVSLAEADGILRLAYDTADGYADWCALQPSLPNPTREGQFNCLGAAGVAPAVGGKCYTFNDFSTDFDASGVIPDPAREVDCARAFACMDQCSCFPPEFQLACAAENANRGELWLRKTGDDLVGVFAGDAGFVNARGARTMLGQVRFQRLPEP